VVQISAHKGGSEAATPATYDAYRHALTTGAEYAEFDIRRTADGVLVVYHDAGVGRAGPPVASLGYADLCDQLGYPVPKAGELMELLAGRLHGQLDLKETGYEQEVVSLALATVGAGNFVVTSLEDSSLLAIKRSFPSVRTALSLGRDLKQVPRHRWPAVRRSELLPLTRLRRCGADWVCVHHRLARLGVIRQCQRNGFGVMVWTVDSDRLIDRFIQDHRIAILITNRPRHAVQRRALLAPAQPGQASLSD
jgi:glycerophosphoryl diester phosphodiesterase